jgi:hypothetical protein
MKKLLFILLFFPYSIIIGQTVLATFPLELKKSKEYKQIVNAVNTNTQEVFVFVTDKETVTILKYNRALFLTDQYTLARPDLSYKTITGYSFSTEGEPTLYWASLDLKNIMTIKYNMELEKTYVSNYYQSFSNETVATTLQDNDAFYILTQKNMAQKLILYAFKDGRKEEKILDFKPFKFQSRKTETLTLNQILAVYPISRVETNQFNPLFKGTEKTKMYLLKNRLLLTFDHNLKETQTFEIDLSTFEITEKKFPQPTPQKQTGLSNSYYHENKMYQLISNEDELAFEIKNYQTTETIKYFPVKKADTISFKNSTLWVQMNGQKPREIKNTAKFLQRLLFLDVGLTVYKTPKAILITIGGSNDGINNYMTLNRGIESTFTGNFSDIAYDMLNSYGPNSVYFESVFDKKLEHSKQVLDPLAVDFISGFCNDHPEISLSSVIRYKNYYILGYYDTYTKQYTMRKFTDGFDRSF